MNVFSHEMMRFGKVVKGWMIVLVTLSTFFRGDSQTYFYSGPVNGWTEIGLNPGSGFTGNCGTYFGNITETLYYNAATRTLRTVGSLTVSPAGGGFNMRQIGVGNVGSATVTIGDGGALSFDILWTPTASGYMTDFSVPITASGEYGGTSFSGMYQVRLPLFVEIFSASEKSLSLRERDLGFVKGQPSLVVNGEILYNGTGGDNTIHWGWQMDSVATANVPEPGFCSWFICGLLAMAFRRRH